MIRDAEFFGVHAGFGGDGHEIGIAEPAWESVKMQVADDARAGGAAQVHAKIHPIGLVIYLEDFFHALREMHHFVERAGIAEVQFGDVGVGDDHDVAGGVGEAVENDENFRAAINDERVLIVLASGGLAKNAVGLFSSRDLRHVLIAPRGPEIVHREASSRAKVRAQHNAKRWASRKGFRPAQGVSAIHKSTFVSEKEFI